MGGMGRKKLVGVRRTKVEWGGEGVWGARGGGGGGEKRWRGVTKKMGVGAKKLRPQSGAAVVQEKRRMSKVGIG